MYKGSAIRYGSHFFCFLYLAFPAVGPVSAGMLLVADAAAACLPIAFFSSPL